MSNLYDLEDTSELKCPYCGFVQQDDDGKSHDIEHGFTECESCDKEFWMSRTVTIDYSSWKLEDDAK